jgi:hypothetical protein
MPLDARKVEDLLSRIRALRAERFVRHENAANGPFDLTNPQREVAVTLADDAEQVLAVSGTRCPAKPSLGFYAASSARPGVALITDAGVAALDISLENLE